jgi:hypothetical protein
MALLIKERGGMKEIRKSNRFLEAAIYWYVPEMSSSARLAHGLDGQG